MNEKVLECIYAAIDDANQDRDGKEPLEKSLDTPIHGAESGLDSLGLVNFIVIVEEGLEQVFDSPLMLSDERALDADPSPFLSVRTLAKYIETLLGEQQGSTSGAEAGA